jgi:hypothetical protein
MHMATYLLRGIPTGVAAQFKRQCASEGRTMRFVLLTLIRAYLAQHTVEEQHVR